MAGGGKGTGRGKGSEIFGNFATSSEFFRNFLVCCVHLSLNVQLKC